MAAEKYHLLWYDIVHFSRSLLMLFKWMYCFELQVQIARQSSNQPATSCCLLFDPEDGDCTFLQNIANFCQITCTWHHIQEDSTHSHHQQNLNSSMRTSWSWKLVNMKCVKTCYMWSCLLLFFVVFTEISDEPVCTSAFEKQRVIWN
jgi:hypothetical protein